MLAEIRLASHWEMLGCPLDWTTMGTDPGDWMSAGMQPHKKGTKSSSLVMRIPSHQITRCDLCTVQHCHRCPHRCTVSWSWRTGCWCPCCCSCFLFLTRLPLLRRDSGVGGRRGADVLSSDMHGDHGWSASPSLAPNQALCQWKPRQAMHAP